MGSLDWGSFNPSMALVLQDFDKSCLGIPIAVRDFIGSGLLTGFGVSGSRVSTV